MLTLGLPHQREFSISYTQVICGGQELASFPGPRPASHRLQVTGSWARVWEHGYPGTVLYLETEIFNSKNRKIIGNNRKVIADWSLTLRIPLAKTVQHSEPSPTGLSSYLSNKVCLPVCPLGFLVKQITF